MKAERFFKRGIGGFVTIEYTLLLPVLLIVYTFLIGIGLYQYNQCLLDTNVYLLAGKGADLYGISSDEQVKRLQQLEGRLYYDKYFLAENIATMYQIRGNHITISGSAEMSNPLAAFQIGEEKWQLYTECTVNLINPAETLRLCKAVYSILEKEESFNWRGDMRGENNAGSRVY